MSFLCLKVTLLITHSDKGPWNNRSRFAKYFLTEIAMLCPNIIRCATNLQLRQQHIVTSSLQHIPIGFMDDVFTYIWLLLMVNVGKYANPIQYHGSYGIEHLPNRTTSSLPLGFCVSKSPRNTSLPRHIHSLDLPPYWPNRPQQCRRSSQSNRWKD